MKGYIRREGLSTEALLPTSLRLAKQIEWIDQTVATLPSEQLVRAAVVELNQQIADYLRVPSGPHVQIRPVNAAAVVARWRRGRDRA